jgi:amino acid transporter
MHDNASNDSAHAQDEQGLGTRCMSDSLGENGDIEVENSDAREDKARLGTLPLAMIVFYNVAGGPFGIEESVRSAGFFFSIMGFMIMPLVWSIPEAMITAELGSAYPEASGGVAWVEEAFGPTAGWTCGWLGWIAGATDSTQCMLTVLVFFVVQKLTSIDSSIASYSI